MDFNTRMQHLLKKLINLWKSGKIQRTGRITYGVIWNVILFFLIIGFIGLFFVGGVGAGYFASLVKDEEIRDYESMEKQIYDYAETSRMYFTDGIFLGEVSADLHRDETTLDEIAPHLINAVIATEDEYFKEHKGIVPKAILRAVFQELTNASTQTGGSTLTQQLIKNQMLTNEVSFERKAKEILLALRLERFFEKEEILEAYLNIVPYGRDSSGRNIAGVQTAAQGIFGIDAKDVNLAQAAYLAGLPQSPSAYTPFANGGGLKSEEGIQPGLNRMKTVLHRMYELEFITEEEYEEALNYDIVADFKEEEKLPFEEYPVLAAEVQERAKKVIKELLMEEDGISQEDVQNDSELDERYEMQAEQALRMNGYEIHTTIDKEMYDLFQEIGRNFSQYGGNTWTRVIRDGEEERIEQEVQGAAIMIENSTGRIISFFGNRNPDIENHFNYAMRAKRSNGSAMKPILVYGPALEEGIIQPGTPIPDVYLEVPDGGEMKEIRNIDRRHHGLLSARTNLAYSFNIPAVRTYLSIRDIDPVEKYLRKMGITTINDHEYVNPSLSLGAMDEGITIEENANAFSTIANYGQFADTYMIEKITTRDGEVVYEHEVETVEVFSPQTSYLLIDMMRDVISDGTASGLRSMLKYPHVDWAGKTGTSQSNWDVHFIASNPNITFATWMGYDQPDELEHLTHSRRNQAFWAELINAASELRPELVAPDHAFQQPEGIVQRSYCALSGKLPSELCERAGLVKTDLFNEKFVPTEVDDSLTTGEYVLVDGRAVMAGPNTPSEFTQGYGLMLSPDFIKENGFDRLPSLSQLIPFTDRNQWEKISFPNTELAARVEDDGRAPQAPGRVRVSGNELTWQASSSKDVVGYRIYYAASPDDNFSRVGSATSTSFRIGSGDGIYHVRAVDYFGLESDPSSGVIVGDLEEEDEPEDEATEEEQDDEENDEENREENGGDGKNDDDD